MAVEFALLIIVQAGTASVSSKIMVLSFGIVLVEGISSTRSIFETAGLDMGDTA